MRLPVLVLVLCAACSSAAGGGGLPGPGLDAADAARAGQGDTVPGADSSADLASTDTASKDIASPDVAAGDAATPKADAVGADGSGGKAFACGLDPGFGVAGKVRVDVKAKDYDFASAVALLADGGIIVGGTTGFQFGQLALVRLSASGQVDETFGVKGIAQGYVNSGQKSNDAVKDLGVQSDGKIVTVGTTTNNIYTAFLVSRFQADGSIDTSFGGLGGPEKPGYSVVKFQGSDHANAMALLPGGKILVGGSANRVIDATVALARVDATAKPDPGFGSNGLATLNVAPGQKEDILALGVQADGKVVGVGFTDGAVRSVLAVRFQADGKPDTGFQGDGAGTWQPPGTTGCSATALALLASGRIVMAGTCQRAGVDQFFVAALLADGTPDVGFGAENGYTFTDFGTGQAQAEAIAVLTDGSLVLAGRAGIANADFALARYDAGGKPLTSGCTAGKLTTDWAGGVDYVQALALQVDGGLVAVGGASKDPDASHYDFAIARYR